MIDSLLRSCGIPHTVDRCATLHVDPSLVELVADANSFGALPFFHTVVSTHQRTMFFITHRLRTENPTLAQRACEMEFYIGGLLDLWRTRKVNMCCRELSHPSSTPQHKTPHPTALFFASIVFDLWRNRRGGVLQRGRVLPRADTFIPYPTAQNASPHHFVFCIHCV